MSFLIEYKRKAPEWAKLSDYQKEKGDGFVIFMLGGIDYCVPLTKEMKKQFGISRRKNKIIFKTWESEKAFRNILMEITTSVYHQVSERIGDNIEATLLTEITDNIENLLSPKIKEEIKGRFKEQERKLLERKKSF